MERNKIIKAIRELIKANYDGVLLYDGQIDITLSYDKLKEAFLSGCETIPQELEKYIPNSVSNVYNDLVKEDDVNIPSSFVPVIDTPISEKEEKTTPPPLPKKEAPKKEPAVKIEEAKPPKKIPSTTKVMMAVVDNPEMSVDQIYKKLIGEGAVVTEATVYMQRNDTLKTLAYIASKGK